MNKKKLFAIIYFIILGLIIFGSGNLKWAINDLAYVGCGNAGGIPKPLPQMTTMSYTVLMVGVPLVLAASAIIEMIKAIANRDTEEIAKAKRKLFKKFIMAAIILLITGITQFVLYRVTSNATDQESVKSCVRCFLFYSEDNCYESSSGNDVNHGTHRRETPSSMGEDTTSNREEAEASNRSNRSNSNRPPGSVDYTPDDKTVEVIRKIIYAVETGGQVYGQQRYDDFTGAYANTSNETAITIGAGGWFATEAQTLLKMIRDEAPETFKQLDTAGIGTDLDTKDWSTYQVSKGSAKANAIVAIIDSPDGHTIQDKLMDQQVKKMMEEGKERGVDGSKALAMFVEIRHCAGLGGAERVLGHAAKPYTAETIYTAATTSWPEDANMSAPITGPMFRTRHQKVYEMANANLN